MKKRAISRRDFLKVTGAVGAASLLAACGGSDSSSTAASTAGSTAASTASGDGVSISLWTYPIGSWGGTESKLDDIIAAFNEVHPEITVTYETLDYQNGDNLVTSAITAKETPDIIMEGPERLVSNWGANNLMVDLKDLWTDTEADIAAVSESVVSACQLDGAYYEYPLCMTTHCMAINYEVFEQAGALQYLDEETRTWTTDDFVKAMETIRDSGLAAVPGIIYSSDELQQFANGTAAVTFCWNASNKAQYASQVTFTPYAMAFPSDDGVPELCGGIWGFGIFDSGDDARIEAAKTFIQFVCDDADQAAESVRLTGFFPVKESLGDVYEGTDQAEQMGEFASLMPYLGDYYNVAPNWTAQRQNWFNMLQEIMVNGTPAQEAADAFVAASNP